MIDFTLFIHVIVCPIQKPLEEVGLTFAKDDYERAEEVDVERNMIDAEVEVRYRRDREIER